MENKIKQAARIHLELEKLEDEIQKEAIAHVEPLLKQGKYKEAKKATKEYFKDSFQGGDCRLFCYDMVIFYINKSKNSK